MGMFSRAADVVGSYVSALIDRARNPKYALLRRVEDAKDAEQRLTEARIRTSANGIYLRKRADRANGDAALWMERAKKAVEAGDDGLAREALARVKAASDFAASLQSQIAAQNECGSKLEAAHANVRAQVATVEASALVAVSRYDTAASMNNAAKAVRTASALAGNAGLGSLNDDIDKLEAAAQARMEQPEDDTETKFARLSETEYVDRALAELKQARGCGAV